jgi:hypothetical protein
MLQGVVGGHRDEQRENFGEVQLHVIENESYNSIVS